MFAPFYPDFDHINSKKNRREGRGQETTHEMLAGLTGHIYPIDFPKSVKQFLPAGFISSLHGTATVGDFTVLRWDPFHIGSDR